MYYHQPKKTYAIVSNMLGMSLEGNAFEMEKELEAIYARLIMFPLSYSPEPILKDFHRDYRSALLMNNFKLIYRYDKERDEIVIAVIWYTKRSQQALLRQFKRKL